MSGLGGSEFLRQRNLVQKVEEMRRQKGAYESSKSKLDKLLHLLTEFHVEFKNLEERKSEIDKLAVPSSWGEADHLAVTLVEDISTALKEDVSDRVGKLTKRRTDLISLGIPDTMGLGDGLEKAVRMSQDGSFEDSFQEALQVERTLSGVEEKAGSLLNERVDAVLKWSLPADEVEGAKKTLQACLDLIEKNDLPQASECIERESTARLPNLRNKLTSLSEELKRAAQVAKDEGVDPEGAEQLLAGVSEVRFSEIDARGNRISESLEKLREKLLPQFTGRLEKLKAVVDRMREGGTDVGAVSAEIEALGKNLPTISPGEAVSAIARLGQMVEGPLLRVIFSQVEEIRPYLEEARSMGRPIDGLVEGMNHTRALLNAKDYARAIDASSATLERAKTLLEDVEIARNEIEEYRSLLFKLEVAGLSVVDLQEVTTKAQAAAAKGEFSAVKGILREGAKLLGRQSTAFFKGQIDQADRCLHQMEERGFMVPPEAKGRIEDLKMLLSSGNIPGALELISDINLKLQSPVREGVLRHVEALNADLDALTNEAARKTVEGLVAEVKTQPENIEQYLASMEALGRVEKSVSITLASEVGRAIEELETGLKNLQAMGVATEDLEREVNDIRQILDTGNFLRALRSAQDFSGKLTQLAMSRAEDALAGAKLAIVEVSRMISEPPAVKQMQDQAREAFQAGRYLESYQTALKAKEEVVTIQQRSQRIVERIGQTVAQMTSLRKRGAPVEQLRAVTAKIASVREAYQALSFENAEAILAEVQGNLEELVVRTDGQTLLAQLRGVLEGMAVLGVHTAEWEERVEGLSHELEGANPSKGQLVAEELMGRVIDKVRPVLEESITSIRAELKIASEEGIDIRQAEGMLNEAAEKMKSPAPVGVAKILAEVRNQFSQNRALQEAAQKALAGARDIVAQAEMMNLDVLTYQARTEEISTKIAATQFAAALELAQEVRSGALILVKDHLNQLIANLQNVIMRAKMDGTLTMTAENYVVQARNKIATNNTADILQLIGKAESELERIELQHSIAQNSLGILESKVSEAFKSGLICPELSQDISEAKRGFDEGQYADVLDLVLRGSDRLQGAQKLFGRANMAYRRVAELFEVASGFGIELGQNHLKEAKEGIASGKYAEAEALSRQAWEELRGRVEDEFTRMTGEASAFLDLFPLDDATHERLKVALDGAHQAKTHEDYQTMALAIDRAFREVTQATVKFLHKQAERIHRVPDSFQEDRARELMVQIDVVMDSLRENRLSSVAEKWKTLKTDVDKFLTSYVDAEADRLAELGMVIERLGLDFTPIIERISEAKTAVQGDDLDGATGKLGQAFLMLDAMIRESVPAKAKDFRKRILRARDQLNVSTTGMEELVAESERLLSSGEPVRSARTLMDAENELNNRKGWQTELMNLQSILVSLTEQAEADSIDTVSVTKLMEEAVSLKTRGDYKSALEKLRAGQEEIRRLLPQA